MPIYLKEITEFAGNDNSEEELGDILAGRFSDLDVDSVEEVRKLRGRRC